MFISRNAVLGRGCVDFERLYAMHQAVAFFVTRVKSGVDARRVCSTATERASGVICDQLSLRKVAAGI